MARSRNKVPAHARHKKIIKAAKGFQGRQYAYVGRKKKKRTFRSLWIQRINAAVREIDENLTYSRLIDGLTKAGIEVDRKMLSELAINEPAAFKDIVDQAKGALA